MVLSVFLILSFFFNRFVFIFAYGYQPNYYLFTLFVHLVYLFYPLMVLSIILIVSFFFNQFVFTLVYGYQFYYSLLRFLMHLMYLFLSVDSPECYQFNYCLFTLLRHFVYLFLSVNGSECYPYCLILFNRFVFTVAYGYQSNHYSLTLFVHLVYMS